VNAAHVSWSIPATHPAVSSPTHRMGVRRYLHDFPGRQAPRILTARTLLAFAFSKDGAQVYGVVRNTEGQGALWELHSIDVKTGADRLLAPLDFPAYTANIAGFSLHPDGQHFLSPSRSGRTISGCWKALIRRDRRPGWSDSGAGEVASRSATRKLPPLPSRAAFRFRFLAVTRPSDRWADPESLPRAHFCPGGSLPLSDQVPARQGEPSARSPEAGSTGYFFKPACQFSTTVCRGGPPLVSAPTKRLPSAAESHCGKVNKGPRG